LAGTFRSAFVQHLQSHENAEKLRQILSKGRLADWTKSTTAIAVEACRLCGWDAAAKGHAASFLPVARSEYLALDVVAFRKSESRWRYPEAVIELENSPTDDKVAYAFWKTLCVHAALRVTFCYRKRRDEANDLVRHLRGEVVDAMELTRRVDLIGETCVVVGHQDEGGTFPFGYFSWWLLDTNTGTFQSS
jgi:hypothetical protein